MKRICTLSLILSLAWTVCLAQNIGINGTGATPAASAILDVSAPDKGLLIPRVALSSTADVTTITGPATSLLVYNTATVSNVTPGFYYWNSSAWTRLNSNDWSITGNAGTTPLNNYIGTSDNQAFAVRTNNIEAMRVTAAGNVGVGEVIPVSKLHVSNGDFRIGEINPINVGVYPGFGRRIYFSGGPGGPSFNGDNSDPIWMARYNVASDDTELRLNLSDNCQAEDAFVIQTGGSGCAAATVRFRFDGTGLAYKPGGGAWAALSDRRLKKDIHAYQDGLSVLRQIRPVAFQYNGQGETADDGSEFIGVIAQEVAEVAPYMVMQRGDYLSVDPSAFTYLLINSVQEQQTQIESLSTENAELKEKMSQMETQMEATQSQVAEIREYLELEAKK
jgi:hypothetical protein